VLREFDLWNEWVTSINGQKLTYRSFTIPCCQQCNGVDFSAVEKRVKTAFHLGIEAVRALDRKDLFLWLGKIYYGIVYLESLKRRNVRITPGELPVPLVPVEHLESVRFHHLLLQAAAGVVTWLPSTPGPASILIYECQTDEDPHLNFDYADFLFLPVLALRLGPIGIVTVLQDWGAIEVTQEPRLDAARKIRLHATQFREIYALVLYITKQTWVNHVHTVVGKIDDVTIIAPSYEAGGGTVVPAEYAEELAMALHTTVDDVLAGTKLVNLFPTDENGDPIEVPYPATAFKSMKERALWPFGP
jgi:hypothetical protein